MQFGVCDIAVDPVSVSRHPAVNLVGITTIDDLTGGRAVFGVGLGSDDYLREIGEPPATRQLVADMVGQCRRLLAGEAVTWRGERSALEQARLRYDAERRAIPIYVAATGPRMLELGGAAPGDRPRGRPARHPEVPVRVGRCA